MRDVPTFSMTPYGCLARLVCFDMGNLTLARTACHWHGTSGETQSLWLILQQCPDPPPDDSRPLYHCHHRPRFAIISNADWSWGSVKLGLKELYIALWHTTPKETISSRIPLALENERIRTPFRITWTSLRAVFKDWTLEGVPTVPFDWDGNVSIAFTFSRSTQSGKTFTLRVILGVCDLVQPRQHFVSFYSHLAREPLSPEQYMTHSCAWDHISTWPEGKDLKTYSDGTKSS